MIPHRTNHNKATDIPSGMRCELCGMMAVKAAKDDLDVVHYYCEMHSPPPERVQPAPVEREAASEAAGQALPDERRKGKRRFPSEGKHAGHTVEMFRDRFWVSLVLTIPILYYSTILQKLLNYQAVAFFASSWITPILGSTVFFFGGLVFIRSALHELKARLPGMMTLIALAITAAYLYSLSTTFFFPGTEFFWELATLITIMLLGHWMEMRSVTQAQGALQELAKLLPDVAERIADVGNVETVPLDQLIVGDIVLVRPGAKVPGDGVVIEGKSSVNESMITGESRPVEKAQGSEVIAGTVNGDGSLKVRITKVGEETALAGIMRLVAEAQASRSRSQMLADRAAFYLTMVAISVGAITLVGWLAAQETTTFALERMVTVLVIACPHALGLAVPLVTAISTSLSAGKGLLVRDRRALETARNIHVVIFDKTGTLTEGKQAVADVIGLERSQAKDVLRSAATVESESEHHLARSIVEEAQRRRIAIGVVKRFAALPGQGVKGFVDRKIVEVLSPAAVVGRNIVVPEILKRVVEDSGRQGKTVVFVLVNEKIVGAITLADRIRQESREAVKMLKVMGVKVVMLTGDSQGVADWVAKELGIDEYFAEVLPKDKTEMVKRLQAGKATVVAFVGDGVNDAPALTAADIGMAIGAGTDVAIESAGIILMKNDPRDVVKIIKLSRATYGKMVQNLLWATGYNVVAIPLAAGAATLFGWNLILPPAVGALLMSASTIIVAANAQLLRRLKL